MSAALTILFRDVHLIAVDKPSGLAVHRGWAPERDVAMTRLRDQIGARVFPVQSGAAGSARRELVDPVGDAD